MVLYDKIMLLLNTKQHNMFWCINHFFHYVCFNPKCYKFFMNMHNYKPKFHKSQLFVRQIDHLWTNAPTHKNVCFC